MPSGGGTAAEVERSGGGLLVRPEDPAALLAALEELGRDPERRERLGAAGDAYARDHLTAQAGLQRLTNVLLAAVTRQ